MALVPHDPEEELRAALAQSAAEFGQREREDAAAEAALAAATRRSLQEHGDTSASAIPLDTPPRPGAPSSGPLAKLSDKLRTGGSSKKLAVLPDNLVSNKV